jgi:DnaJ-class molecular chaperone
MPDYCRANGLCPHCHGIGISYNESGTAFKAVGWDGDIQLFEQCETCGGAGKLVL